MESSSRTFSLSPADAVRAQRPHTGAVLIPLASWFPPVLAQAVAIISSRLGGLNNGPFFLTALEAGESKIRVPAGSGSARAVLMTYRRPRSSQGGERTPFLTSLLPRALIPSRGLHPRPNHLPTSPSPGPITLGLRASPYEF